jgi:hypothetical protein
MSKILRRNPLEINIHLKKMKDRKVKLVLSGGGYPWEEGTERMKEGEYGDCILYT